MFQRTVDRPDEYGPGYHADGTMTSDSLSCPTLMRSPPALPSVEAQNRLIQPKSLPRGSPLCLGRDSKPWLFLPSPRPATPDEILGSIQTTPTPQSLCANARQLTSSTIREPDQLILLEPATIPTVDIRSITVEWK